MHRFYYVARLLSRIWLTLFTRRQVYGKENIPGEGPLLVVANHVTAADPPLIAVSFNRKLAFMAKAELFRSKFAAYFLHRMGTFPVRQGRLDIKALRLANQLLAQGLALVIFPEGRSSPTGQLQPALPGSALIAARNGTPVLPVGITGTSKIKGITWPWRRPRITVNIGRTFLLPPAGSRLTKAELAERAQLITSRIAELLPEDYHGDCKP
jgi:1-acyl-sn-glycerol-3-phosphate acyltransferase